MLGTSEVDAVYTAKAFASRMPANKRIGAESAVTPVRVARALRGIAGPGVRRGVVGVAGRAACWPLKVGGREAGEPLAVVRRAQAAIGLSKNSSRVGVGLSVGTIGRQKAAGQARAVAALRGRLEHRCGVSVTPVPALRVRILSFVSGTDMYVRFASTVSASRVSTLLVVRGTGM